MVPQRTNLDIPQFYPRAIGTSAINSGSMPLAVADRTRNNQSGSRVVRRVSNRAYLLVVMRVQNRRLNEIARIWAQVEDVTISAVLEEIIQSVGDGICRVGWLAARGVSDVLA